MQKTNKANFFQMVQIICCALISSRKLDVKLFYCLLSAVDCALSVSCVCTSVCFVCGGCYQSRGELSIISFNYPKHSKRPKLTPLLSSGCWKKKPCIFHDQETNHMSLSPSPFLWQGRTYHCYLSLSLLPFSPLLSAASMLSECKTKVWIINIHTVCMGLYWRMWPWWKNKIANPVSPLLVCFLSIFGCAVMCRVYPYCCTRSSKNPLRCIRGVLSCRWYCGLSAVSDNEVCFPPWEYFMCLLFVSHNIMLII